MIYDRRHTKMIADFGGLQKTVLPSPVLPLHDVRLIGLPGLNGFVGEFLVLIGATRPFPASRSSLHSGWCWRRSTPLGLRASLHRGPGQGRELGALDLSGRDRAACRSPY